MLIRRVFAFIIDAAIAALVSLVPFIGWLFSFLYMLLRDALTPKGSPGKRLFNLEVTTKYGRQITYKESFRRNFIFALPSLLSLVPLAGWLIGALAAIVIYIVELLAIINDPQGRRNGDRWAGTVVKELSFYR